MPNKPPMMTSRAASLGQEVRVVSTTPASEIADMHTEEHAVGVSLDMSILEEQNAQKSEGAVQDKQEAAKSVEAQHTKEVASRIRAGEVSVGSLSTADLNDFMSDSIVARPLRMPTFLDVRAKDPNYRLRWVNFKSQGGARYDSCCAMGFIKAVPEEVIGLSTDVMVHKDGIKYHDVILMKIRTADLWGQYKLNAIKSSKMVNRFGAHKLAEAQGAGVLRNGIIEAGYSPNDPRLMNESGKPKMQIYIPDEATAAKLTR